MRRPNVNLVKTKKVHTICFRVFSDASYQQDVPGAKQSAWGNAFTVWLDERKIHEWSAGDFCQAQDVAVFEAYSLRHACTWILNNLPQGTSVILYTDALAFVGLFKGQLKTRVYRKGQIDVFNKKLKAPLLQVQEKFNLRLKYVNDQENPKQHEVHLLCNKARKDVFLRFLAQLSSVKFEPVVLDRAQQK